MNKGVIGFVFILILIVGIFIAVYFFYEKPIQENSMPQYYNITVRTYDSITEKQISTGLLVTLDENTDIFYNGSTISNGYTFVQIPVNRTFTIYNYNIRDQNYYTNFVRSTELNKDVIRFDIPIYNISTINVSTLGGFGIDNPVYIKIISTGNFNDIHLCFDWSSRIIKAFMNSTEMPVPDRLKNKVVRCYETEFRLNNSYAVIPIYYTKFGTLDETDFIKAYIIDSDVLYYDRTTLTNLAIEDKNKQDVGGNDILYIIKNI